MNAALQSHQNVRGNDCATSLDKTAAVPSIFETSDRPAELLGSVTHSQETDGLITGQIRSSARVSKKMRLDCVNHPLSAVLDKKEKLKEEERLDVPSVKEKLESKEKIDLKDKPEPKEKLDFKEKADQKEKIEPKEKAEPKQAENKQKRLTQLWSTEEKNTFFEALYEFGKDFDAIENYFATKASKKGMPERMAKTRLQIRHFYLRTWHKISKYLKFPENSGMKRVTQELYGLINYGEMRKRIGFITEKICTKLNELVYRGTVHIRLKGKIVRIKTPMCRILRKINRLDENEEVVRLPTRVSIELRPKTNEAWQRVQSVAQNPRIKTKLPLQRRLSSLLSFLDHRWQHNCARHIEMLRSAITAADPSHKVESDQAEIKKEQQEALLTIGPAVDANICVSAINLTEYLTSLSVCLNTYHERFGLQSLDDPTFGKGGSRSSASRKTTKKSRGDSVSAADKKLPADMSAVTKPKEPLGVTEPEPFTSTTSAMIVDSDNNACDSDPRLAASNAVDAAVNNILALNVESDAANAEPVSDDQPKTEEKPVNTSETNAATSQSSTQADEETIARIRRGWNMKTAKTTTIGDLYLMFGANGNLRLDYWWEDASADSCKPLPTELSSDAAENEKLELSRKPTPNPLADTLQKLVSIANLESLKKAKVICPCGHVCGGSVNRNRPIQRIRPCVDASDRNMLEVGKATLRGFVKPSMVQGRGIVAQVPLSDGVFRRPLLAPSQYKPGTAEDFKAQLEKFRPRFCNRRGRAVRQKNVVVQRQLPLLPKAPNGHAMVTLKVIPQTGEFMPISSPSHLVTSNSTNVIFPSGVTKMMSQSTTRSRHILPAVPVTTASVTPATVANITASLPSVPVSSAPKASQGVELSRSFDVDLLTPSTPKPSISKILDLPLSSSAVETESSLNTPSKSVETGHVTTANFGTVFLPSEGILETSTPPPSPSRIFKDETSSQWLTSEVVDYSLSSLLGHLESPAKPSALVTGPGNTDDTRFSSDVEAQLQCMMTENSVDYTAKFADLAARIASSSDASKK